MSFIKNSTKKNQKKTHHFDFLSGPIGRADDESHEIEIQPRDFSDPDPSHTEHDPPTRKRRDSTVNSHDKSWSRDIQPSSHSNLNKQEHELVPHEPKKLTDDFEKLFDTLKLEITEYIHLIEAVQKFSAYIARGHQEGIFDDQDLSWVEDDLKKLMTEKNKKEIEYQKRKEIYENSVVKLEKVLEKRKKIIEEANQQTHVFDFRPDLLKNFAQKRAALTKIIEQGKKDLQNTPFGKI